MSQDMQIALFVAEFLCLWVIAAAIKIIPKMETIAAAMIAVFGIDSCCHLIW